MTDKVFNVLFLCTGNSERRIFAQCIVNRLGRGKLRGTAQEVIRTVCDRAAAAVCPVWPGQPMTAHWGVEDPAEETGDDLAKKAVFSKAFREVQNRNSIFVNLPLDSLDRRRLQQRLDRIGRMRLREAEDKTT